jgi:hypothetical protein
VDIGPEIEVITVEPIEEPGRERESRPEVDPAEQPAEPELVPAGNLLTCSTPACEQVRPCASVAGTTGLRSSAGAA